MVSLLIFIVGVLGDRDKEIGFLEAFCLFKEGFRFEKKSSIHCPGKIPRVLIYNNKKTRLEIKAG